MSGVEVREVSRDEGELRLDRWFKRHYPGLSHGRLEKLLRTGQVRVDGARAKAGHRLAPGQRVRVPPLGDLAAKPEAPRPEVSEADSRRLRRSVLYRDDEIIAINKPPGLAVQGGTRTRRHLDAMLDALPGVDEDRPRLVHRLDRDTSGVLVLARTAAAAARLGAAFRSRKVRKLYWALVVGRPRRSEGRIQVPLAKLSGRRGERVAADEAGRAAVTDYKVLATLGRRAAWLALVPRTGRTHQLRAHCAALGTPVVGDAKYGGGAARLPGGNVPKVLHLHARAVELPGPGRERLRIVAPLPEHMRQTWRLFGFDPDADADPFTETET